MNSIKYVLLVSILGLCLYGATPLQAAIALDQFGFGWVGQTVTVGSTIQYLPPTSESTFVVDSTATTNQLAFNEEALPTEDAKFTGRLLNYPNPFSFRAGTQVGYQLTGPMTIELKIFTITGYLVAQKTYMPSEEGGLGKYNIVSINQDTLGGQWLAPGVYIYALFSEGRVVAKNRMVVMP
ncbi:MAG: hypothetical protein AB7F28_05815 [Candidatus Margulisiibacteriota bacterium]